MSRRFDDRDNNDDNNDRYCDANDDAHLNRVVNNWFAAICSNTHTFISFHLNDDQINPISSIHVQEK